MQSLDENHLYHYIKQLVPFNSVLYDKNLRVKVGDAGSEGVSSKRNRSACIQSLGDVNFSAGFCGRRLLDVFPDSCSTDTQSRGNEGMRLHMHSQTENEGNGNENLGEHDGL